MQDLTITVEAAPLVPLSAEAFADFGTVLEVPDSTPDRLAGTHAQLWNLADLEFTLKSPFAGVVRYFQRGYLCDSLERHPGETQTFIPVDGNPSIVAVAKATDTDLPDLSSFTGFLLDGKKGIKLHRGTWVRHFFPVYDTADYVVITGRRITGDDVDNVDLRESFQHAFEFVLDLDTAWRGASTAEASAGI